MATLATGKSPRIKKWRARVKDNWVEYYLGVYMTKEEAQQVEQEFKLNCAHAKRHQDASRPH